VFQLFHTYVANISSKCFKSKSGVAASVLDACFMCFICLQTYVTRVTSGCFKSTSGVASMSSLFCCLTFASESPPPPGAGWASAASSPSSGCCCSHPLRLLAACMRVRSEGGVSWDSSRVGLDIKSARLIIARFVMTRYTNEPGA
jgi:hypothetical protein